MASRLNSVLTVASLLLASPLALATDPFSASANLDEISCAEVSLAVSGRADVLAEVSKVRDFARRVRQLNERTDDFLANTSPASAAAHTLLESLRTKDHELRELMHRKAELSRQISASAPEASTAELQQELNGVQIQIEKAERTHREDHRRLAIQIMQNTSSEDIDLELRNGTWVVRLEGSDTFLAELNPLSGQWSAQVVTDGGILINDLENAPENSPELLAAALASHANIDDDSFRVLQRVQNCRSARVIEHLPATPENVGGSIERLTTDEEVPSDLSPEAPETPETLATPAL